MLSTIGLRMSLLLFVVLQIVILSNFFVLSSGQLMNSLTAPSAKIHVTFKRKTMKIHGYSEFDIFASPAVVQNNVRLLYNGYAIFTEGNTNFKYLLVNGAAFLETNTGSGGNTTVRCFHTDTFPFDDILHALNDATPIPSASVGTVAVDCPSKHLFKTSFSGAKFAICASGTFGFTAYSSDMTIAVEYLNGPINISMPKRDNTKACAAMATPVLMTPTGATLLTGISSYSHSRKLKAEGHMAMEASSCGCKSTPRPCIFLHGLGNPHEEKELQDTPELTRNNFGFIGDHAPCCTTVKYAVLNTVDYGWTNDTLQQKFCDHSLSMSKTSDAGTGIIKDTIVVTHSMGGLVMAMALATGKCKFDESTSWVSISAPMRGSMAGDFTQSMCLDKYTKIVTGFLELIGECPASLARKTVSYQNEKYSTPELNAAYTVAQEAYRGNVSAAMCSKQYNGLVSVYQLQCIIGGTVVPHKSSENDGLVEYQSCLGGLDPALFGSTYTDRFYRAKLNHADTAFLTHDGFFRDSQKPFKWFECLL